MRVEKIPFNFPAEKPRSGVHLSDILKSLLHARDPKRFAKRKGPVTPGLRATFERGIAFEELLKAQHLWPSHILLQQEFIRDNIICTLDGIDPIEEVVYESKCTILSGAHPILDVRFVGWKWQIMGYCFVARVPRAYLDVLHLCGDWRPPTTWPPVRWVWTFERHELQANWDMIRQERDRLGKEGLLPC